VLGLTPPAAAELELLPNERAFAFSARGMSDRNVEVQFVIADGYYLYRDKLRFTVVPGAIGPARFPAGKIKEDKFFGRVETYRKQIAIRLPLEAPLPGRTVTVNAESQGCADAGVCYPPQVQKVTIVLPVAGARPGALVEAAPRKKSWFN
jgi:thiol:disulfide interchange protein DsbD